MRTTERTEREIPVSQSSPLSSAESLSAPFKCVIFIILVSSNATRAEEAPPPPPGVRALSTSSFITVVTQELFVFLAGVLLGSLWSIWTYIGNKESLNRESFISSEAAVQKTRSVSVGQPHLTSFLSLPPLTLSSSVLFPPHISPPLTLPYPLNSS